MKINTMITGIMKEAGLPTPVSPISTQLDMDYTGKPVNDAQLWVAAVEEALPTANRYTLQELINVYDAHSSSYTKEDAEKISSVYNRLYDRLYPNEFYGEWPQF